MALLFEGLLFESKRCFVTDQGKNVCVFGCRLVGSDEYRFVSAPPGAADKVSEKGGVVLCTHIVLWYLPGVSDGISKVV